MAEKRRLEISVTEEDGGRRAEAVLKSRLAFSGTQLKRLKRENGILLNGRAVFASERVNAGDTLAALIENASVPDDERIAYFDEDIIVFDKPAGMPVHPAPLCMGEKTVRDIFGAENDCFHPVNRLDRGTTGLMVIARSGYAHERLKGILHTDKFVREYLAVTEGIPEKDEFVINAPIEREGVIKRRVSRDGAFAETKISLVRTLGARALVKAVPLTGRTHQIRVHLSSVGLSLSGDWLYGREDKALIARPALHCFHIKLFQPITEKTVEVFSPLPEDMAVLTEGARLP